MQAYGEALVELGAAHEHLVVLDADLASDCRVRTFELTYPERFLECGIAEQDMVSAAAGIARHGLLPVVNSFASFLASRANEQIYNQASEKTKVVYALHYAGLIPAGPGKSHQSVRDVSLLAALPNMTIVQPANGEETAELLRWAVEDAEGSVALRLAIGPSPRRIELRADAPAQPGRGAVLRDGDDAVLFAYGPVMLHEALLASESLERDGVRRDGREHAVAQPARRGLARRGRRLQAGLRARGPRARRRARRRRPAPAGRTLADRIRRRRLARVRDAAGGAALPRARRWVAGAENHASARAMSRPVAFAVLTFPRSGSTWLMNMLDSHPEVAAYDELFLGGEGVQPHADDQLDFAAFVESVPEPARRLRVPLRVSYLRSLYRERSGSTRSASSSSTARRPRTRASCTTSRFGASV